MASREGIERGGRDEMRVPPPSCGISNGVCGEGAGARVFTSFVRRVERAGDEGVHHRHQVFVWVNEQSVHRVSAKRRKSRDSSVVPREQKLTERWRTENTSIQAGG